MMKRLVKEIKNRNQVEFDKGIFDDWCVYLLRQGKPRYAPRDHEYFSFMQTLGIKHGSQKLYNDFVSIYNQTGKEINSETLQLISDISNAYGADAEEAEIWFTVIYAGMVAEENKLNTKLGKRIKRLGIYQILIENSSPETAAVFSKGKKWKELDDLMKTKGF